MVEFSHVIATKEALHARPVAMIAACVMGHASAVVISCCGNSVAGDDLMGLMGLPAHCGDELTVTVEGPDEEVAAEELGQTLRDSA